MGSDVLEQLDIAVLSRFQHSGLMDRAATEIRDLRAKLAEVERQKVQHRENWNEISLTNRELKATLAERDAEVAELRAEIERLRADLAEVEADNSTLRGDIYKEAARRRNVEATVLLAIAEARREGAAEMRERAALVCNRVEMENRRLGIDSSSEANLGTSIRSLPLDPPGGGGK